MHYLNYLPTYGNSFRVLTSLPVIVSKQMIKKKKPKIEVKIENAH